MESDPKREVSRESRWYSPLSLARHSDVLVVTLAGCIGYAFFDSMHWHRGLFKWLQDGGHFIDLFTIWLASSGILYALRHEHELTKQTDRVAQQLHKLAGIEESIHSQLTQITEQSRELKRLDESLSTRRVGAFPAYVRHLAELVEGAKASLDILVDCVDYGSFFAPQVHQRLHDAILHAKRNMPVRMLVCGGTPKPYTNPSGLNFNEYRKDYSSLKKYLTAYCRALHSDVGFDRWIEFLNDPTKARFDGFKNNWFEDEWRPSDLQQALGECLKVCRNARILGDDKESESVFRTLLQARQLWFAEELWRHGVEIRGLITDEPMYLWIRDKIKEQVGNGDEGLFTFAKAAHGPGQLGYRTHDSDLLETFRAIFDELWCKAESVRPAWLEVVKMI